MSSKIVKYNCRRFMPASANADCQQGGKPAAHSEDVRFLRREPGYIVYAIAGGKYEFTTP